MHPLILVETQHAVRGSRSDVVKSRRRLPLIDNHRVYDILEGTRVYFLPPRAYSCQQKLDPRVFRTSSRLTRSVYSNFLRVPGRDFTYPPISVHIRGIRQTLLALSRMFHMDSGCLLLKRTLLHF